VAIEVLLRSLGGLNKTITLPGPFCVTETVSGEIVLNHDKEHQPIIRTRRT
jgi:hypothetical protein